MSNISTTSNSGQTQPVEFAQNGKFIPVDQATTLKYVYGLLNEYDTKILKGINVTNESNPYRDKIVMPVGNGKFVGVPEELHQHAVDKWLQSNGANSVENLNSKQADLYTDGSAGVKPTYIFKSEPSNLQAPQSNDNQKKEDDTESDKSDDGIVIHDNSCECKQCARKIKDRDSYFYIKIIVCILILIAIFYGANTYGFNGGSNKSFTNFDNFNFGK